MKINMFLDFCTKNGDKIAAYDQHLHAISYTGILSISRDLQGLFHDRPLVFILCENSIGFLAYYLACMINEAVPLLLNSSIDQNMLKNLVDQYQPELIICPDQCLIESLDNIVDTRHLYKVLQTQSMHSKLNPDLSLLLATSGSTGSPKLVRHSHANLEFSARSVAEFLCVSPDDRTIASLPVHYTMGLSVVHSFLYAGATILLANSVLTDKSFWDFVKRYEATCFTGVPYSFEILDKLRFYQMNLPHLRTICQGGGKLKSELFSKLAKFCRDTDRRFFATYGQTEGSARMAYLAPELAQEKICSIGNAIPGGELSLIDDWGETIENLEATGELVYRGSNVTMGYAECRDDLNLGDDWKGLLHTGDIASRDRDGCYYIVGRKARFLKIYGHRVSLDEVENLVRNKFGIDCYCNGDDTCLQVNIEKEDLRDHVHEYLVASTSLYHQAIKVINAGAIKRNEYGKIIKQ